MTGVARQETVPFLDLVAQHRALEDELMAACLRSLRSAAFVGGGELISFEKEFAGFLGAAECVGVASGTDALRFAYMAMEVRPGDEIITVPNTFIATTEAITQAGGAVRFVDVDDDTLTMAPSCLEAAITARTVGIVPVHLYGQPADMASILAIAAKNHLWVIEDAAQAHGAEHNGRPCGTLGELGAFSFYPGKNLGACGEAGATVGSDPRRLAIVRRLRDHGQATKYHHDTEGYNGRLDAIQAAFLRVKLRYLPQWIDARRRAADWYRDALVDVAGVRLPIERVGTRHAYHLFVVRVDRRDKLQTHLSHEGIGTGLHYPLPLHLQRAYGSMGLSKGAFPVTERAAAELLSLPMFPEITREQVDRVAGSIRRFYQ